jgi:exosome complex RNA-binding protein Csl4
MSKTSVGILALCLVVGTTATGLAQSSTSTSTAASSGTKTTTTTAKVKCVKGEVIAVDAAARTIRVKTKTGDESFIVAEKCTITINGKKGTLADIKPGDIVRACYTTDAAGQKVVLRIVAKSPKTPPAGTQK